MTPAFNTSFVKMALVSALFAVTGLQAQTMLTQGQLQVNEFGAATYRVPIQTPPGIGGVEPKLALTYNNQAGNGLLGVGWNLEGLSSVTRCPRTTSQDGAKGTVNLDLNDRFCLDGQRLVLVSGTYGLAGSEYRTERDSFSKVVATGAAGNGPASFTVKTKAGLTMEFGNTADSRIEAQGNTTVRAWALNKVSDVKGNFLAVSYTEDSTNGSFYLNRIDYTGNSITGSTGTASVRFVWDATRTDAIKGYLRASVVSVNTRLKNVRTYVGESLVKDYRITYEQGVVTSRSRLKTLTECDAAGACLPATTFGWWDPAVLRQVAQTNAGDWKTNYQSIPGDFNGDGITDLYLIGKNGALFCAGPKIASQNNCVQTSATTTDWFTNTKILQGDYNNDGRIDLLIVRPAGVLFCNGTTISASLSCTSVSSVDYYTGKDLQIGDFNADGILDLFVRGNGIRYCTGLTTSLNCKQTSTLSWGTRTTFPGDFDGDGATDLLAITSSSAILCRGSRVIVDAACKTLSLATNDLYSLSGAYDTLAGDFNGDGNADIIIVGLNDMYFCAGPGFVDANNCVKIAHNTGNYYGTSATSAWIRAVAPQVGDFNGDGATDIYFVADGAIYLCTGPLITKPAATLGSLPNGCQGVGTPATLAQGGTWKTTYTILPGDFNGDGTTDLYLVGATSSHFYLQTATIADLMNKVTDGVGTVTVIGYSPITNVVASVYTKDTGTSAAVSPQFDIQYPMYVVNTVQSQNPGGTLITNYTYGGLKAEWGTGRGLLGFRYSIATQANMGIATGTVYSQSFPYTGMPIRTFKTANASLAPSNLLSLVDNTFSCVNPVNGAACTSTAGTRYFPYVAKTVEQSWDLNGTVLPVATTTYVYDTYGNPTQIVVGTNDGFSKTSTNTYTNDATNWFLGRLTRSTVTSTAP